MTVFGNNDRPAIVRNRRAHNEILHLCTRVFFKENAGAAAGIYVLTMYSMLACVCVVTSDVLIRSHSRNKYVCGHNGRDSRAQMSRGNRRRRRRCHRVPSGRTLHGFYTHASVTRSRIYFLCSEVCRKTYRPTYRPVYRVGATLCADGDFVPRRTGDQTGLNRSNFVHVRGNLSTGRKKRTSKYGAQ